MVDIEINAWSSRFLNIETNLIFYLYPEKFINSTNQSRVLETLKFCAPFKINIQTRVGLSNFEKPVRFFSTLSKKEWIKQDIKSVHIGYSD